MKKILIVDDNTQNLYMLAAALKGSGYEVREAKNGREALETARREPPDLIISDILMPEMDGYELCRRWKSDEGLKKVPFIFYTATYTDPKDEAFGLSLGAEMFIKKPVRIEELQRAVQQILEEGPRRLPAGAVMPDTQALEAHRDAIFRKLRHKIDELAAEVEGRRRAESALGDAVAELKEKNRQLQDFIFIVSSDLGDKVADLRGAYAEIARLSRDSGQAEALRLASAAVEDMDRLITGLLRIGRVWDMPFKREPVDMEKLTSETLDSAYYLIKHAQAEVKCGPLPPCTGDRAQIRKVLAALLENALKYRSHSRQLQISISGEEDGAGAVVYRVRDNGQGLSKQEEEGLVWQLFYRGALKDLIPGEGVSLTIAKRIVEKHGGRVGARSAEGGGAEFLFSLPAAQAARREPPGK